MRSQLLTLSILGIVAICHPVSCPVSAQHKSSASEQKKAKSSRSQARDWWKEEESRPIKIVSLRLQVPFTVHKGQLALCIQHSTDPPMEAVYLISLTPPAMPSSLRGSDWARCLFEVKTLNDLRGYVHIQTPQQALAYVRLLTSPRTFGCFPRSQPRLELEVVSQDTVTSSFMFSDQEEKASVKAGWNGWWGILDQKWAKRYPGLFATCIRSQEGFLVKRTLLVEEWNKPYGDQHHLEHIEEWVGQDGRYLLQKRTRLPAAATPAVEWYIPKKE